MRKYLTPIVLYLLINLLFIDKYTMRFTEWHYLCDAIYLLIGSSIILGLSFSKIRERLAKILLWTWYLLYCIIFIVLQYKIDPFSLQVDRWSAIHNFLSNLFHGVYPYSAQTHLGGYGSPFPIWQILHIPFYLLGNVGLSFFFALTGFLFIIVRCHSARTALITLILVSISPAINYEILVRSDLITNFICVCALCEWLRYKSVQLPNYTYLIAILVGICASTRLAAVIPLALLYGYAFLQLGWKKQLGFIMTLGATFTLIFLPFLLWDGNMLLFFEYNPFVLQTRQGGLVVFILFALIAIGWTIYIKDRLQKFNFYAGGLLTILVVFAFIATLIQTGNYNIYSSQYDITYFNMALPFYILEIAYQTTP